MDRMNLYACLCLAVFPVSIQAVATLSTVGPIVANQNVTFECAVTTYNPSYSRLWIGPPSSTTLINTGLSANASKYDEIIEASNNRFLMIVINFASSDEGDYRCRHRFDISNTLTINRENVSVYPSSPPLENLIIPSAGEEISLSFSVPGIRPAATASYNLTSAQSMQTAIVAGSATVTNTNDAVGGTFTSTIQITVAAGTTNVGDLFTITLLIQDYSSTKQWTITANPTPNCDCTPEKVLLALSIVIMCIVLIHSWMVFFYTKGIINWNVPVISKCDDDKSPVNIIVVTIAITLFCVLGVVLCAVGLHISLKCTLEDNTSLILTIVGFVLVVVGLVLDILHVCLFKKKTGQQPTNKEEGVQERFIDFNTESNR